MSDTTSPKLQPPVATAVVGLCAMAFALVVLSVQPLRSSLYWWHVAMGQLMVDWQRIPDLQLHLFALPADHPWVYPSWLGSVVLSVVHDVGGADLNLLLRNLLGAASVGLIAFFAARRIRRIGPVVVVVLVATTAFAMLVGVTPTVLTLPVVTVFVAAATMLLEDPTRVWPAFVLPAGVLAIINLDFATALAVIFVALVTSVELLRRARHADERRPIVFAAAIAALSALSIFGFAYGPSYWVLAFASAFSVPENLLAPSLWGSVLIVAASVAAVFRADAETLPAPPAVLSALLVGTMFFAAVAPSTAAVFAVTVAFVLIAPLAALIGERSPERPRLAVLSCVLAALTLVMIAVQPGVPTRTAIMTSLYDVRAEPPHPGTMSADLPLRCAEELRRTGRTVQVFHAPEHAGFLLYHLLRTDHPHPMLFDDHRALAPAEHVEIADLLRTEPAGRGHFQQLGIDAAVIDASDYSVLVHELDEAPDWYDLRQTYDDPVRCFLQVETP